MSARFRFDDTFFIDAVPIRESLLFSEKQRVLAGIFKSIIAVITILGMGFLLLFQNTQPISDTGYEFINSLQTKNYSSAYNMLSTDIQSEYSLQEFEVFMKISTNPRLLEYPNLHTVKPGGDMAQLQGTIGTGRSMVPILLETQKQENEWKIQRVLLGTDPFAPNAQQPLFFPSL